MRTKMCTNIACFSFKDTNTLFSTVRQIYIIRDNNKL